MLRCGFIVSDHADMRDDFVRQVGGWLADGTIKSGETAMHGIEHAADAFIGLLAGANTGKMVVELQFCSGSDDQPAMSVSTSARSERLVGSYADAARSARPGFGRVNSRAIPRRSGASLVGKLQPQGEPPAQRGPFGG